MKKYHVLKNTYYDSVTLMRTGNDIKTLFNFNELVLLMATDMNKEMIKSVNLYHEDFENATPNDLLVAADMNEELENWTEVILAQLTKKNASTSDTKQTFKTINQAAQSLDANLAVISVPGIYAFHEAVKALDNNLHVMMFSDNVSVADEIKLKDIAIKKDLLMMGPDCGTAIINGVGLCFANKVSSGNIGLVAASGTGLQEVTVIIDRFGGGITQAIGVGGRDLSKDVGGRMTLHAINALNEDANTEVIVIISKPPHPSVTETLLAFLKKVKKPVVLCLLDAKLDLSDQHIHPVANLTEAAVKALSLTGKKVPELLTLDKDYLKLIEKERTLYQKNQTKVKGLFCGGTLAAEALSIIRPHVKKIQSNVAKKEHELLLDPTKSDGHQIIDLGDDVFTQGKPHPMIEPTIRLERLLSEAKNPETAVILLDFELGYGSHEDPVGISLTAIKKAQELALKENRHISFVAYVCGTNKDPQNLIASTKNLENAGVIVGNSNAHASLIAASLVKEVKS